MIFKSKPHTIEAFQFTGDGSIKPPKWFCEAHEKGKVMVVMNAKSQHISIYSDKGEMRKAHVGDWICMNSLGTIFPLTNAELLRDFEVEECHE